MGCYRFADMYARSCWNYVLLRFGVSGLYPSPSVPRSTHFLPLSCSGDNSLGGLIVVEMDVEG